jgi:hypothetical protein
MADIFISYSKSDHALALKLSTFLESEGWTVWWDKSLAAADLYRDEIMKQLAAARAVVTIWTENSIKSDWVRAEAGTAKKEGKLIAVKTADVAYADIPLPFGEMHTENIESTDLIRAAVVAQLAKPAVEPTAVALLMKGFKWELLTWWGIIGGAVTLFSAYSAAVTLSPLARKLVENWKEWTHAFWVWAFSWLGIHLPPEWTPILSFLLFWSLLAIGQAIKFKSTIKTQPVIDKYQDTSLGPLSWRQPVWIISYLIGYVWPTWQFFGYMVGGGSDAAFIGLVTIAASFVILLYARHKVYAAVAICLLGIFWLIITLNQIVAMKPSASVKPNELFIIDLIVSTMMPILPVILLSVAPAKAVSRRLIFLAIGLLLLIALNELSKFAPKLHEWGL